MLHPWAINANNSSPCEAGVPEIDRLTALLLRTEEKMKVNIVSPGSKKIRLSIERVLRLVLRNVVSDPHFELPLVELTQSSEVREEMKLAHVRSKFLGFCRDGNILPRKKDDPPACFNYDGDVGQDKEFDISVEEFKLFARSYGIDVVTGGVEFPLPGPEVEPTFSKLIPIRRLPRVALPSPSGEEVEETWDDPEIEDAIRSDREKRKARLKKKIPGKLPKSCIGKLAVKIAWEIEVDTDRRAPCKAVMDRLCKLAARVDETDSIDSNEDCLRSADTTVPGQEMVRWATEAGLEKWFGQNTCKQALRTWKNSIPQKTIRRR